VLVLWIPRLELSEYVLLAGLLAPAPASASASASASLLAALAVASGASALTMPSSALSAQAVAG
jgi:hypothetical protein